MKPTRILLVGGGHAHIEVIRQYHRRFGGKGIEVVLVSPEPGTAYSGMLPGVVAGHYQVDQILINLPALCADSGVRWHQGRFVALGKDQRSVVLEDGSVLEFDYAAFDIGSTPNSLDLLSAQRVGGTGVLLPAKPVTPLLAAWEQFLAGLTRGQNRTVTVVGGGVAGFELALAMHHRIRGYQPGPDWQWHLISRSEVLAEHNPLIRRAGRRALAQAGFQTRIGVALTGQEGKRLQLSDGSRLHSDFTLLCTPAAPVQDLRGSLLPLTDEGFIPVTESLQVVGHERLFAVGDIARFPTPIAKAGVYAVRQGPVLAANLSNIIAGRTLQAFVPQGRFLKLITLGERKAMASRGWFYARGDWVWRWKHRIDSGFMEKYQR
ncbi:MAG: FAD-dependent oxidoreductase [Pseudomonadota bacterium]|nr:FAD-dependent oxidoreductase [Pseudomonadota bacterium]